MIDAIVTGAEGFIGRNLVRTLKARGLTVKAASRSHGNVEDRSFWETLPPARLVYHLAGRSYVPDSWLNPGAFTSANVVGTQNGLEWCKRNGARFILASAYVYGIPERLPIREDDSIRPNNPYALSKRLAEQVCEFFAEHDKMDVSVLRLFNVYGPGQRQDFLIPTLLSQILSGSEIKVMDLEPRRDFVFIEDVVDAFVSAMDAPGGFHCVNIGSGQSLSVAEIIEALQRACGTSLPVTSACLSRRNEIIDVRADISHAARVLGWYPRWDISAGTAAMAKELLLDRS
jgi:nucleoside-diphosphate-sugar epimerase